jgi:hypothetical protein
MEEHIIREVIKKFSLMDEVKNHPVVKINLVVLSIHSIHK